MTPTLKRSMPCTDLNSMESKFMAGHYWDGEMENVALKRRRISPLEAKRNLSSSKAFTENPATEALDRFLRMAVDDLTPVFDLVQDESCSFPKLYAFAAPLKSIPPTMHELTRGMARVSASS